MANVLVYTELADGRPSASSLAVLAEARRVGSQLGATVYALLACADVPSYADNDAIAILGRHGADKVILVTAPELARASLYFSHGPAVLAACTQLPPALLLFPDTPGGADIAPRVAARLGAAYGAGARIEIQGDEVLLARPLHRGACERRLAIEDIERPVVLTCEPPAAGSQGEGDAEVIVVPAPPAETRVEEVVGSQEGAPTGAPARLFLLVGRAALPEALRARLGRLGADVVPEGTAWELPPGGVAVALGPDPNDPRFARARFGLVGEPADLAERLLAALGSA